MGEVSPCEGACPYGDYDCPSSRGGRFVLPPFVVASGAGKGMELGSRFGWGGCMIRGRGPSLV